MQVNEWGSHQLQEGEKRSRFGREITSSGWGLVELEVSGHIQMEMSSKWLDIRF